jgi:NAD(P)H-flavin reductase
VTVDEQLAVTVDPVLAPRVHEVVEVRPEIPDVVTLRVVPVEGVPTPFLPAQVSMVGAFGIGEAAISISSSPRERSFHEYTIRHAGAITGALTSSRPGDQLWTRGPFGTSWDLDHDDADVLVVAGGIGIAPLRAALLELADRRDRFRSVTLVVGARCSPLLLFQGEYDSWRAAGIDVVATVDVDEPGWVGPVGLAPSILADVLDRRDLDPARTRALVCGPDVMMRIAGEELIAAGVEPDRIQLTIERNMQCGNGRCGHCQLGPVIVCRDGPVVRYPAIRAALSVPEI